MQVGSGSSVAGLARDLAQAFPRTSGDDANAATPFPAALDALARFLASDARDDQSRSGSSPATVKRASRPRIEPAAPPIVLLPDSVLTLASLERNTTSAAPEPDEKFAADAPESLRPSPSQAQRGEPDGAAESRKLARTAERSDGPENPSDQTTAKPSDQDAQTPPSDQRADTPSNRAAEKPSDAKASDAVGKPVDSTSEDADRGPASSARSREGGPATQGSAQGDQTSTSSATDPGDTNEAGAQTLRSSSGGAAAVATKAGTSNSGGHGTTAVGARLEHLVEVSPTRTGKADPAAQARPDRPRLSPQQAAAGDTPARETAAEETLARAADDATTKLARPSSHALAVKHDVRTALPDAAPDAPNPVRSPAASRANGIPDAALHDLARGLESARDAGATSGRAGASAAFGSVAAAAKDASSATTGASFDGAPSVATSVVDQVDALLSTARGAAAGRDQTSNGGNGTRSAVRTLDRAASNVPAGELSSDDTGFDLQVTTAQGAPQDAIATAAGGQDAAVESAAKTPVARIELSSWAERVAESARLVSGARGDTEMRLRLEPEELGHIDLRISLDHDSVRAVLVTEHETTRALLSGQRHLLEAALERSDLRLSGFSVDVGTHGGSGSSRDLEGQMPQALPVGEKASTDGNDGQEPPPPTPLAIVAGHLSLRV